MPNETHPIYDLLLPYLSKGLDTMQNLLNLARYFAFTVSDGDYLNDWITHLPEVIRPDIIEMGKALATLFGN